MRRKFLCLAVSVLASPAFSAPPELPQNADAKAAKFFNDYYTAYAENDYDRMASYYDSDAVFEDPTSDSFIRGAEKLRKAMDLLDDFRNLHWRFHQIVREGDTYAAQATLTGTAYGTKFATRFATIVTFKNGKLIRHVDFLDNRPIAAASQGVASESLWEGRKLGDVAGKFAGRSKKGEADAVARKYLDALEHADGEAAGALYDEAAIFEDPTFHLLLRGRSEIEDYAKAAFPNYEYVRIHPDALISNADGAVIEGTGFGVNGGFQTSMRFMTFLRVTDGRITSQADFYDYGEYERLTRARDLTRDTQKVTEECDDANFRKLDFWIGDWVATAPGGTKAGRNRIERIAGGCAIMEHWQGLYLTDGADHFGRGLHWFDPSSNQWRQQWIDDAGAPLESFARIEEAAGLVYAPTHEPIPGKKTRMTVRPVDDGRVEQFGEESHDGGNSWSETFRLYYSRAE